MGQIVFLPPETCGDSLTEDESALPDLEQLGAWDVAVRYHELKVRPHMKSLIKELRRISAVEILKRARAVMGSIVHPIEQRSVPWSEVPGDADQADIDIDETLENAPAGPKTEQDIWMSYEVARRQSVVLAVDTSLSMTGEKLALTAVALAVVLLQFPKDSVGIVAFENEAKILKRPDEQISLQQLVERFLDVPAQGYTHLEDGLRAALGLVRDTTANFKGRPPSVVLLSDGKYTAGRDPAYLAVQFPHLVVLKMGSDRASLDLCRELAQKGRGVLREVPDDVVLPHVMYGVVKDLLRGRS